MEPIRFAFAGDRDISVRILEYINKMQIVPQALLLSSAKHQSHAEALRNLCPYLEDDLVFYGKAFCSESGLSRLRQLDLEYIISIHFPYIFSADALAVATRGVINLHPAYLPFNKGWHTPSWSILEDTPYGATLHFMDESLDTGDIIQQKRLYVSPGDTADSLYHRVKEVEFELFKAFWPSAMERSIKRVSQTKLDGTAHSRIELFNPEIQKIHLDDLVKTRDLLRVLRGLTTNKIDEAAYFEDEGKFYRVQVQITEEQSSNQIVTESN